MKRPIAVAISGGVDSLVAAHLLEQQGHPIWGIHFITGYETDHPPSTPGGNGHIKHIYSIREAASRKLSGISRRLKIPIDIIDCSAQFKRLVVDYFSNTYQSGMTPNPCLVCNPGIKFGVVLSHVHSLGVWQLATGHYARTTKDRMHRFHLLKGVDSQKDQSYFLSRMAPAKLASAHFPLGEMTKAQVVDYAQKNGLEPAARGESQDICFIRDREYTHFLNSHRGWKPTPGAIEDVYGNILGTHKGLHHFTVGQRRAINCPGPEPYYVIRLDAKQNRVVVGGRDDLLSQGFVADHINWINPPGSTPVKIDVRIRYRHQAVPALVTSTGMQSAVVRFFEPQYAVTPGQGAVFYRYAEVLGGGWIRCAINEM